MKEYQGVAEPLPWGCFRIQYWESMDVCAARWAFPEVWMREFSALSSNRNREGMHHMDVRHAYMNSGMEASHIEHCDDLRVN